MKALISILSFFLNLYSYSQIPDWQYMHLWESDLISKNRIETVLEYSIIPKTNPDYNIPPIGLSLESKTKFNKSGQIMKYCCYDCTRDLKRDKAKNFTLKYYYRDNKLFNVKESSIQDWTYYYEYSTENKYLIIRKNEADKRESLSVVHLDSLGRIKQIMNFDFGFSYIVADSVYQICLEKKTFKHTSNKMVIVDYVRFYKKERSMIAHFSMHFNDYNIILNSQNISELEYVFEKISNNWLQYNDSTILTYTDNSIIKNRITSSSKNMDEEIYYKNDNGLITSKKIESGFNKSIKQFEYIKN